MVPQTYSWTLIKALIHLFHVSDFDAQMEKLMGELIRNGWICTQHDDKNVLYRLLIGISQDVSFETRAAFRITRQLLALGLFRIPSGDLKLSWAQRLICWLFGGSANYHLPQIARECPVVARLVTEFDRKPLSLQQLSRIEIRHSIQINGFERRVKTLPLPPPLLTYVWQANEFLDVNFIRKKVCFAFSQYIQFCYNPISSDM